MLAAILKHLSFIMASSAGGAFFGMTFGPSFAIAGCYIGCAAAMAIIACDESN